MEPKDLGYTNKWLEYGLINIEIFNSQIKEFEEGDDQNTEHYRYGAFLGWLRSKEELTDTEIENYIELAKEDPNELMGGSAVKELFISSLITDQQFDLIKSKLPEFGDWTKKLINRETLVKRLRNDELTEELFQKCLNHKNEFKENRLIELVISITENTEFLSELINLSYGKRVRNLANEKLKRIKKAGNSV